MSARLLGSGCASAAGIPASANNATTATNFARPIIRLVSLLEPIWAFFMANQGTPNDQLFPYIFRPLTSSPVTRGRWPKAGGGEQPGRSFQCEDHDLKPAGIARVALPLFYPPPYNGEEVQASSSIGSYSVRH